jgi:sirohydrochlorin cobaltochelatase
MALANATAVVLVGHGAPPRGAPGELVSRLKALEGRRRASGAPMSDEERELDRRLRDWPRAPGADPYRDGLLRLREALAAALPDGEVVAAYNEFCAPSVEEAVHELVARGALRIVLVPSMLTRGGVHSEVEIPETLAALRAELPAAVELLYAWPFEEADVAALLAARVRAQIASGGESAARASS